jgi:spermidine synthase
MSFASLTHAEEEGFWNLWFSELHKGNVGMTYKVKRILYSGQSRFQRIDVLDTHEYGRMLVLYGSVMISDRDDFVYPEMIAHVPYYAHAGARSALVIGGGDGLAVGEFLKHPSIERIVIVDIDEMVIEKCKEFFPRSKAAFSDPKVEVHFADGAEFVKSRDERFDIIIVDGADPIPPADVLFHRQFHENCREILNTGGIFVSQTESPFYNPDVIKEVYTSLGEIFRIAMPYVAWIPTYPSALWSFAFCSDTRHPLEQFDRDRCLSEEIETRYYNADIHAASFALPTFIRELI